MKQSKDRKPLFRKWWVWAGICILVVAMASGCASKGAPEAASDPGAPVESVAPDADESALLIGMPEAALEAASSRVTVPVHNAGRDVTLPSGTYVWIPATGSKFHNKSKCGNMDPDRAQRITVDEAQERGYEACEKCY